MKMKPIALAAISGLVIALAGMPAMADDNVGADQSMQNSGSSTDSSQPADNSQSQNQNSNSNSSDPAATGSSNTDEGNPDTPSGDDY